MLEGSLLTIAKQQKTQQLHELPVRGEIERREGRRRGDVTCIVWGKCIKLLHIAHHATEGVFIFRTPIHKDGSLDDSSVLSARQHIQESGLALRAEKSSDG
jgi:hypothetical protein